MKRKLLLVLTMCLMLSVGSVFAGCDNLIPNHKVSFDTLGYGTIQMQVREKGQPVKEPEAPERAGYTFVGWTLNGEPFDFETLVEGDMTLVAKWVANEDTAYKVEHYRQNVADNDYVLAESEDLTGTTDTPTQAQAKDYDGFTAQSFEQINIAPNGNAVVKIYYDRLVYSVTIDENGGSETPDLTVRHGGYINVPLSQKVGYELIAWLVDGVDYDFNAPITQNLTLVAKWEANTNTKYKVEHYQQNVSGDGYTLAETENLTGTTDTLTNAVAKEYAGFTEKAFEQAVIKGDGSAVVKIYYDRLLYSVTIDENGGVAIDDISGIRYGTIISAPVTTRTNYVLEGWYFNGEKVNFANPITQDMQIVANWVECTYQVKHYQQAVAGEGYELVETETISADPESTTNAVAKEYVGFTAKAFEQKTVAPNGSTVVEIYYDRLVYSVAINENGGSEVADYTVRHGAIISAPATEKVGYTVSWNYDFANAVTGDVVLEASWTAISVNVTFTYIDGSSEVIVATYDQGLAKEPAGNPAAAFEYVTKLNGNVVESIDAEKYKSLLEDTAVSYEMATSNMTYSADGKFTFTNGDARSQLLSVSDSFMISATVAPKNADSKAGFMVYDANGVGVRFHAFGVGTLNYCWNGSSAMGINRIAGNLGISYSEGMTFEMSLLWDAENRAFFVLINGEIKEMVEESVIEYAFNNHGNYSGNTFDYDFSAMKVGISNHAWGVSGDAMSNVHLASDIQDELKAAKYVYGLAHMTNISHSAGVFTTTAQNAHSALYEADGSFMISANITPKSKDSKPGFMIYDANGKDVRFHAYNVGTLNYCSTLDINKMGVNRYPDGLGVAYADGLTFKMTLLWDAELQAFFVFINDEVKEAVRLSTVNSALTNHYGQTISYGMSSVKVGLSGHAWGITGDIYSNVEFGYAEQAKAYLDADRTFCEGLLNMSNTTYVNGKYIINADARSALYDASGSFVVSAKFTPKSADSKAGFMLYDANGKDLRFHAFGVSTLNYASSVNTGKMGVNRYTNNLGVYYSDGGYEMTLVWDAETQAFYVFTNGEFKDALKLSNIQNAMANHYGQSFSYDMSSVTIGLSNHAWGVAGDIVTDFRVGDAAEAAELLGQDPIYYNGILNMQNATFLNDTIIFNGGAAYATLYRTSRSFMISMNIAPTSQYSKCGFEFIDANGTRLNLSAFNVDTVNQSLYNWYYDKKPGVNCTANGLQVPFSAGMTYKYSIIWDKTSQTFYIYANDVLGEVLPLSTIEANLTSFYGQTIDFDFSTMNVGIVNHGWGCANDVMSNVVMMDDEAVVKKIKDDTYYTYGLARMQNITYDGNGTFTMPGSSNCYSTLYSVGGSFYISADFAPMSQYSKPGFAILDANGNYLRFHAKNNNTLNYYRNNSSAWIDRSVGALGVTYSAGMTYKMGLIWDATTQHFYVLIDDKIKEVVPLAVVLSDMSAHYGETITYDLSSIRVGLSHHTWSGANEGAVVSGITMIDDDATVEALADDKYFEYSISKLNDYLTYDGNGTFKTATSGGGSAILGNVSGSFDISANITLASGDSKIGFVVRDANGVEVGFHIFNAAAINYVWRSFSGQGVNKNMDLGISVGVPFKLTLRYSESSQAVFILINNTQVHYIMLSTLNLSLTKWIGAECNLDFSTASVGISNHGWGVAGDVLTDVVIKD